MPQFAPASIVRKPLLQAETNASITQILVTGATGYIGELSSNAGRDTRQRDVNCSPVCTAEDGDHVRPSTLAAQHATPTLRVCRKPSGGAVAGCRPPCCCAGKAKASSGPRGHAHLLAGTLYGKAFHAVVPCMLIITCERHCWLHVRLYMWGVNGSCCRCRLL